MTYVRRLTRGYTLTYHRDGCRHAQRDDVVQVTEEEVREAMRRGRFARVTFEGRTVALNTCQRCLPALPEWPPNKSSSGSVAGTQ